MERKTVTVLFFVLFLPLCAIASSRASAFNQGCAAFKDGDWNAAMMLLRRSTAEAKYDTDSTWYMLIMAEVNGGAQDAALSDCDTFIAKFADSQYLPLVQYQKGRALYMTGEYDKCTLFLSDFCHNYPQSPAYPSALFWIAESFFAMNDYDSSGALYTRIVEEFPDCGKAAEAKYKLQTIAQQKREEELLYLVKKTGEELMATKEDYERQLRLGTAEASGQRPEDREQETADRGTDARGAEAALPLAAAGGYTPQAAGGEGRQLPPSSSGGQSTAALSPPSPSPPPAVTGGAGASSLADMVKRLKDKAGQAQSLMEGGR